MHGNTPGAGVKIDTNMLMVPEMTKWSFLCCLLYYPEIAFRKGNNFDYMSHRTCVMPRRYEEL